MEIKQSFSLALKSLATSKMRAFLTMLGIIVGVGAVIIIISLGDGMQRQLDQEFDSLGANLIQVSTWKQGGSRSLQVQDMYDLVDENPAFLKAVSPYVEFRTAVKAPYETFTPAHVIGGSEDYLSIRGLSMDSGRFLQYIDIIRMQKVCVVGAYINETYYEGNAVGKTISINGFTYHIVGVLSASAQARKGSDDDTILLPYTNALRQTGGEPSVYLFSGAEKNSASTARAIIEKKLTSVFGDSDSFFVMTSAEMQEMMTSLTNTLMTVLVAIAALSLLVGGVGIMNIMLVSVTERTREIGIRKSLGAKQKDIRTQFIIESATTSAVGGVLGILFGILMANVAGFIISQILDTSFSAIPSVSAIAIAFSVSVAVGVIFGYMPANKAAKLNPIDALRFD